MTAPRHAASIPSDQSTREVPARTPADRLTVAAGVSLLLICVLHTAVFAVHPWWAAWLAGPFRTVQPPADASVQFWGLPGGFVVPGVLLALLILGAGRRGTAPPAYVGATLGFWALACIWMVGPSGFVFILVPAVLLLIARARSRGRGAREAD
ncbi:DUF6463 family protein [Microbacterium aurantiacum]|uniref:DUF6463 family protein n=1 Tax=Microbacterium aurantiacum TaxID=162393 RepID=UPI000C804507|nr:DUF6463 family protein [Microbacterium aurantiacum]